MKPLTDREIYDINVALYHLYPDYRDILSKKIIQQAVVGIANMGALIMDLNQKMMEKVK